MRKAGGTTARRVLAKISEIHGIEFCAREGQPLDQDDLDEETFVVMNIRHPFDRTCSLFNDQGLWRGHDQHERTRVFDEWLTGEHCLPSAPPLWFLPRNFIGFDDDLKNRWIVLCIRWPHRDFSVRRDS